MELGERRKAQAQAFVITFGEGETQDLVEEESGFEVGAGEGIFDGVDAVAEVEAAGVLVGRGEQALEAAAQIGGLGDVRLGSGVGAAQEKDGGGGGDGGEEIVAGAGRELEMGGEHRELRVRIRQNGYQGTPMFTHGVHEGRPELSCSLP